MADAPDTVTDALALLAAEGYTADFNLDGIAAHCPQCGSDHELDGGRIERQFRFEGASDPDDEAIVLGISCPSCATKGVLVSAYGPNADPDLMARLTGGRT